LRSPLFTALNQFVDVDFGEPIARPFGTTTDIDVAKFAIAHEGEHLIDGRAEPGGGDVGSQERIRYGRKLATMRAARRREFPGFEQLCGSTGLQHTLDHPVIFTELLRIGRPSGQSGPRIVAIVTRHDWTPTQTGTRPVKLAGHV